MKIDKGEIIKYKIKDEPKAKALKDFTAMDGWGILKDTEMFITVRTRAPRTDSWMAMVRIDNGTGIKKLMPVTYVGMENIEIMVNEDDYEIGRGVYPNDGTQFPHR